MSETRVTHAGPAAQTRDPVPATASPAPPSLPAPPPPPPAQQAVPAATGIDDPIVDSRGRILTLRPELTFLQDMDLQELAGARTANPAWMDQFMLAMRVGAIDGLPVPLPRNEVQLRATLQQVGREGLQALIDHFVKALNIDEEGVPQGTSGGPGQVDAGEQAKN